MLVDQPTNLPWMPSKVRRKFRGDDQIDPSTVAFTQIEQSPGCGMRKNLVFRIPLERQRDAVSGNAARAEGSDKLLHEQLGTPADQRHLCLADKNCIDRHLKKDKTHKAEGAKESDALRRLVFCLLHFAFVQVPS